MTDPHARRGAALLAPPGTLAVLVDLDGTLLDTAPDLAAAANAMLTDLGLRTLPEPTVREFIGQGIERLVTRSLDAASGPGAAPGATLDAARAAFAVHYERLNGRASRIYPGVREGLQAMRAAGLRLACVTNKAARFTAPLLAATRLAACFDAVVTSDAVGRRKPDPEVFRYACRALAVEPARAVVIGDSDNDARGARAAGCTVWLVPYGYREGRDVHDIECDGIVPSLMDAARAIDGAASTART